MKKKGILAVVVILLVCAAVFGIYWKATEHERFFQKEMKDIQEQVQDFRAGERDFFYIYFLDWVADDPRMEECLIALVKEMCENKETEMLIEFLGELEYTEYYSETLAEMLNEHIGDSGDIEYALSVLDSTDFKYGLEYYNKRVIINRDTGFIAAYIDEHGTQDFNTTPGEGYYANEEDSSKKHVVGLENSPLHDSETITYMGDFKIIHSHGVRLNAYYEETSYSSYSYLFKDSYIDFGPNDGEIVWSGEYLFCFDDAGNMIGFSKL